MHGIKYQNLYDFISAKATSGLLGPEITSVTEAEFRDALTSLENDYVINLIGHRLAPTIRFINAE